jgi:hypothetical protein
MGSTRSGRRDDKTDEKSARPKKSRQVRQRLSRSFVTDFFEQKRDRHRLAIRYVCERKKGNATELALADRAE